MYRMCPKGQGQSVESENMHVDMGTPLDLLSFMWCHIVTLYLIEDA